MEFLDKISFLYTGFAALVDWRYVVMWLIGGILIYLAIKKDMEPTLLLPLGFGTILVNTRFRAQSARPAHLPRFSKPVFPTSCFRLSSLLASVR